MKKIFYLLLLTTNLWAQKKNFTMQEAVLGLTTTLAPLNLKQLQWMGEDNTYLAHVVKLDTIEKIVRISVPDFTIDTIGSLASINNSMQEKGFKTFKTMPTLNWLDNNLCFVANGQKYFKLELNRRVKVSPLFDFPEDASNINIDVKTMQALFTLNHNLYYYKKNGKSVAITNDGNEDIVYGESVHRNEFGIENGIFWSPKANAIAYYRMDQSMVANYPITNWTDEPATVKNIKYPFAGGKSHEVSVYIYDISSNRSVKVDTRTPADQYLTCISWHPEETNLYVAVLNRAQNDLSLNKYDAKTGAFINTLLNEKNEKYVEPQHALFFPKNRSNEFLWWSQKDGFMHLYAVNDATGAQRQITEGRYVVNELLGFNEANNEAIIASSMESSLEKNIYAVDLGDKVVRKINRGEGIHTALLNKSATYIIDNYSNSTEPKNIEILSVQGDFEKRLLTAKNPIANYNTATIKNFLLKANDNTNLHARLILPYNFDSTKKYPTIVYLYNGPHVQLNKNSFPASGNLWYDYLTQNNYIVFVMDGRGSSNRGFNFESATHKKLGDIEIEDQLKGVAYLKSLAFVDTNKLGLHGWSFGGFMTTSIMLKHPGIFKAAVAGGPVMDWSKYEVMYTERYMGTPENNKEGFANSLLLDKTKNLKGKLMVIHGTDDDVVVWQHSNLFIKNCVSNGVQVDSFSYPGHPHNVRGKDRVHLMQKITDYFDTWLK